MRCYLLLLLCVATTAFADQWQGNDYHNNSSVQQSHAARLLSHLNLRGDEAILDLGCGNGRIAAELAERVHKGIVIGVDPSESMLAKAYELQKQLQLPNLYFYQGSAQNLSLKTRFDHIIAIHVMHWVKEQELALQNIYEHLNPSGQIHFILAPSKEGLVFDKALKKTVAVWFDHFDGFVNPQQTYDIGEYRKLLIEANFLIESLQYIYHESIHPNREKLTAWIQQWLPHYKHLSTDDGTQFIKELVDNYLLEQNISPDTSDPIVWGEYVFFVDAKK